MEATQEEDDPLKQEFSEQEEAEFRNAMLDALPDGTIAQVAINYLDKYPRYIKLHRTDSSEL